MTRKFLEAVKKHIRYRRAKFLRSLARAVSDDHVFYTSKSRDRSIKSRRRERI